MADEQLAAAQPDGGGGEDEGPRRRRAVEGGIPLDNLLRLLAGARGPVGAARRGDAQAAGSAAELVNALKATGMLNSEAVARAMLVVPRDAFVPPPYAAEAWVDAPIRVEEHGFNISAPHMHAQMLESLDIQPGDRVLDAGCGCGLIAAAAALLAGRGGSVVGVDIKPACISLSSGNIARLAAASSSYAASACPVTLLRHNIFIPTPVLKGKFNKVCVGATCPEDRLHLLLPLLDPEGGKLLAPIDNDLRLYTRGSDGKLRQRVVSSVRFSDLEVPSDASIALSVLQEEQAARLTVTVSQPSLAADLAGGHTHKGRSGAAGRSMWSSCFSSFSSLEAASGSQGHSLGSSGGSLPGPHTPVLGQACQPPRGPGGARRAAARQAEGAGAGAPAGPEAADDEQEEAAPARSSGSGCSEEPCLDMDMSEAPPAAAAAAAAVTPALPAAFGVAEHGEPDCELIGHGWKLAAHAHVLKSRSAHFRARLTSGMRDAHDSEHKVPEGFSEAVMRALLAYVYTDALPEGLDPPGVVQLLHAACYYHTPRLIELCEARLVQELLRLPLSAAAAEAPHLLCLADELGLVQLRRAAAAFIAQHFADVQRVEGWHALDRCQVELVAGQLSEELGRVKQLLADLQLPPGVSIAPKRRGWW